MSVMMRNGLQYAGVPDERLDSLEEIVGDGQQSVGSDLTDAVTQLNSSLTNLIKIKNYPLTPTASSVVTPYSYFTAYQITDIPNTSTIIGLVVLGGDSINPAYARLGSDFVLRVYGTKNEQVTVRVTYI